MKNIILLSFVIFVFQPIYAQSANDIMVVMDNLRLRESDSISSKILTTMRKGTFVRVMQIGKEEIIDKIKSNWYFIRIENTSISMSDEKVIDKHEGWCFGGYLELQENYFKKNLNNFLNSPFDSFNSLQNKKNTLVSLFGDLLDIEAEEKYWWIWETTVLETTYTFDSIILTFRGNRIDSITITSPKIKLNSNIVIGMTKNDVNLIFGEGDIGGNVIRYNLDPYQTESNTVDFYYQDNILIKIYWFSFVP